jgi:hypothetical protein
MNDDLRHTINKESKLKKEILDVSVSNRFKKVHAFQPTSTLCPLDKTNPCESAYAYYFTLIGFIANDE